MYQLHFESTTKTLDAASKKSKFCVVDSNAAGNTICTITSVRMIQALLCRPRHPGVFLSSDV